MQNLIYNFLIHHNQCSGNKGHLPGEPYLVYFGNDRSTSGSQIIDKIAFAKELCYYMNIACIFIISYS